MRDEPRASETTDATEIFEADRAGGPDDDKTVQIRTTGSGTASPAEHAPGRLAGGLFGAVTVMPALLAAAWLLPALPLLLAGRLSAPPLVFMSSPLFVGLCYLALRQAPTRWPGFRGETEPVPWWAVAATVAVAAGFAVWQIAERSQQVIAVRDPAVYLQVASWIAHHGSLPIPYSADAFGGPHPGLSFASLNYDPTASGLAPDYMTGLPLLLAAGIWLGGVPAALVVTPLIGACAVLSFGGLAGRLVGARWAPAAAAALALSLPEQYTSRGTFSEPLAQVLLFGGLCLLIDALVTRPRKAANSEAATSEDAIPEAAAREDAAATDAGSPREAGWPGPDRVRAALAGLVLGLVVLVRVDGLSDLLPAIPFLGLLLAAGRRQAAPLALGLLAGAGFGLADGYLLARPYLDREASSLRPLGVIAAVVILLSLASLAAASSRAALARLPGGPAAAGGQGSRAVKRLARWLPLAAGVATVAAFAALALRPLVQKAPDHYDQNSLYWVIWYVGLPAVLLGAFGLAGLVQRSADALLTWKDPAAEARAWALPLGIALWVIVTVLWRPAIVPGQPWASSRLVPFVLPGLILGATWASARLRELAGHALAGGSGPAAAGGPGSRVDPPGHALAGGSGGVDPPGQHRRAPATSAVVAFCCAASLLIPAALTNLDLDRHLAARGMAFQRIGSGELPAVDRLCADIGPDASLVILDPTTADRFAQVTRGLCDTPTAVLGQPTQATVTAVISGIQRAGRRPVLLAQHGSELTPYGGGPRPVVSLTTTEEARDLTTPPTRTWPVQYTVWMSNPT